MKPLTFTRPRSETEARSAIVEKLEELEPELKIFTVVDCYRILEREKLLDEIHPDCLFSPPSL